VSEWAFVAPYLTLVREDAPQRTHDLSAPFLNIRRLCRIDGQTKGDRFGIMCLRLEGMQ
jgi:hypothetical protein